MCVVGNFQKWHSTRSGLDVWIFLIKPNTKKKNLFIFYFPIFSRVRKILNVRVFEDESGKRWAKSTSEVKREILCVSQFTLCHTLKGNKPDFRLAMGTEESKATYEQFLSQLRSSYEPQLVKGKRVGRKPVWMKKKIYKQLFSIFFRWCVWCLHASSHWKWWPCDFTIRVHCICQERIKIKFWDNTIDFKQIIRSGIIT